jgi:MerR family mercuric resistance operon transcriptional regulator
MNAYTVSRLALDAGVSVHIVRDYLLRGLLRPVACTPGGYGLFDDAALQRLCFVRAAFEAGIGLDALARLCRALDAWSDTMGKVVKQIDAADVLAMHAGLI